MIFDDLHDPRPPRPGMREFAIVAERARAIRRRRTRHAVRWACALILVVCGAAIALTLRGRDVQTTGIPTVPTFDEEVAPAKVLLSDADRIVGLVPVTLAAPVSFVSDGGDFELSPTDDARVCAEAAGQGPVCASPRAGLVAIELSGIATADPLARAVVIVVDGAVDVNFLTVGVSCRHPRPDPPVTLGIDVWLCDGLDLDGATVDVRAADFVVIATTPDR